MTCPSRRCGSCRGPASIGRAAASCTACRSAAAATASVKSIDRGHFMCARCSRQKPISDCSNDVVGLHAGHRLHHGLDLFAEVLVGHAEHRGIGHLRVRDQQVLALLRVDVDAARDDHEGRAVGEVQEAVVVDVADVAHGGHGAVGRARRLRALGVVEVLERRCGLEPQLAGLALRRGLAVLVEHVQLAEQHLAHRAAMRQPLGAVAGGEAQALGGAVVLVDDRAPPFDHLLLHRHRARCRRVHRDVQRRQVVALAHAFRQLEHAAEHRGHQLDVRDAVLLDQRQALLGIEVLHDHHGAAVADGQRHVGLRRRVVQRRRARGIACRPCIATTRSESGTAAAAATAGSRAAGG